MYQSKYIKYKKKYIELRNKHTFLNLNREQYLYLDSKKQVRYS